MVGALRMLLWLWLAHSAVSLPPTSVFAESGVANQASHAGHLRGLGERLLALLDDALATRFQQGKGSKLRPKVMRATVNERPPQYSLWSILEPFDGKLVPPFTKFTGDAGTPLNATEVPRLIDDVVNKFLLLKEHRSAVLRLEHLAKTNNFDDDDAAVFFGPLADVVRPFLPIGPGRGETTAHVYMSNGDASALENHTDVTEILVVQLLGRKAWLYCTADESDSPQWLTPKTTLPAKLSKCTTYDATEMTDSSLTCQHVVTAPGDMLFLPRRTVHSARAVSGEISVHLTLGVTTGVVLPVELNVRRRLEECATGCDETCDPSCDEAGCDGTGCDGAGCDGSGCDGQGCDGDGCVCSSSRGSMYASDSATAPANHHSCDDPSCDGAGCDGSGCDICFWCDSCDYDENCDNDEDCDYDASCECPLLHATWYREHCFI